MDTDSSPPSVSLLPKVFSDINYNEYINGVRSNKSLVSMIGAKRKKSRNQKLIEESQVIIDWMSDKDVWLEKQRRYWLLNYVINNVKLGLSQKNFKEEEKELALKPLTELEEEFSNIVYDLCKYKGADMEQLRDRDTLNQSAQHNFYAQAAKELYLKEQELRYKHAEKMAAVKKAKEEAKIARQLRREAAIARREAISDSESESESDEDIEDEIENLVPIYTPIFKQKPNFPTAVRILNVEDLLKGKFRNEYNNEKIVEMASNTNESESNAVESVIKDYAIIPEAITNTELPPLFIEPPTINTEITDISLMQSMSPFENTPLTQMVSNDFANLTTSPISSASSIPPASPESNGTALMDISTSSIDESNTPAPTKSKSSRKSSRSTRSTRSTRSSKAKSRTATLESYEIARPVNRLPYTTLNDVFNQVTITLPSNLKGLATLGDGLDLGPSCIPGAGRGVYATRFFKKSSYVTDYGGEYISRDVADKKRIAGDHFYIRSVDYHTLIDGIKDAKEGDPLGSMCNDSVSSKFNNCKFFRVWNPNKCIYHIVVQSIRDIYPGEEILVSYGRGYWDL